MSTTAEPDDVLELRRAGRSYASIAKQTGITASAARARIRHAENEFAEEAAQTHGLHLMVEIERLKMLTALLYRQIRASEGGPDPDEVTTYLRLSKQLVDFVTPA